MGCAEVRRVMKACTKCGESKPREMFHRDRSKSDGLYSSCKACVRALHRDPEHMARARERKRTQAYKDTRNASRRTPEYRERARRRRQDPRYRAKRAAREAVSCAIARGDLVRAADVDCEKASPECSGSHEWHHDSYLPSDWLRVRCLCKRHHTAWHRQHTAIAPVDSCPTPHSAPDGGRGG